MKFKSTNKLVLNLISVFLALITVAFPFMSCNSQGGNDSNQDTTTISPTVVPVSIDLNSYSVVYPSMTSSDVSASAFMLVSTVKEKASLTLKIAADYASSPSDTVREILIGNTNRPESTEALNALRDAGEGLRYMIKLTGNKIVITGSNDTATKAAIDYFVENYLIPTLSSSGTISLPESLSYISDPLETVDFITNGKIKFSIVRPDDIEDIYLDKVTLLRSRIAKLTGIDINSISIKDDYIKKGSSHDADAFEVLVGNTNYDETAELRNEYGESYYGVRGIGNKIVIYGLSPQSLEKAIDTFCNMIEAAMDDKAGSRELNVRFVREALNSKTPERKNDTVPMVDGPDELAAHINDKTGALESIFENATADHFNAYCQKLEASGFTLSQQNTIGENLFATYASDDYRVHTYFIAKLGRLFHLVYKNTDNGELPSVEIKDYEKLCTPTVTQLSNPNTGETSGSMGYVLRLEDSSFIIVDGGLSVANEAKELYDVMKSQNVRPDGKIIVRLWIITHGHNDHYNVLRNFAPYLSSVKVEAMAGSYISSELQSITDTTSFWDYRTMASSFGCKYYDFHTGQKICYAGATITVCYTVTDHLPSRKLTTLNNSSTAFFVDIGNKRIFFGGDIEKGASDAIMKMYNASDLKCDIVQVCHHGYHGGSTALYTAIDADIALWPASKSFYVTTSALSVNNSILKKPGIKIYVAGDGLATIELSE